MPTSASNSGSGRKISSPRCSPSNRWFWQGDGLPLTTQNTTGEFVYDLDRLSRKLAHQLLLSEEFEQASVALRIVTMPDGAKTPEAQLLANVRGIIGEYERAKILERTARGRRGRAQAGHATYGRRPLGYLYVKHTDKG